MGFGKTSLTKRAKEMDKKLDQIVKNPYEDVRDTKTSYVPRNNNKRPIIYALSGAVACLAMGVLAFTVTNALNKRNDINPVIGNSSSRNHFSDDTTSRPIDTSSQYIDDRHPLNIDIEHYNSKNFGYGEYAFFIPFMENSNSGNTQSIRKAIQLTNEDRNDRSSFFDEEGRLHYPIDIQESYSFRDFYYFEFENTGCEFLDEKIGKGLIQGLTVETEFHHETMLVLKRDNNFFTCFLNGASYENSRPREYRFSAHKFIEGWDLVKDVNLKTPLNVIFKNSFLGGCYFEVDNTRFEVDRSSTYYVQQSFEVGVNDVRAFIGLEPDGRFGKDFVPIDIPSPLAVSLDDASFTLEEFGETPFKKQLLNINGYLCIAYKYGDDPNDVFILEGLEEDAIENKIYLADINYDGYREIMYLSRLENGSFYVRGIDLHNHENISETIRYRGFDIKLTIRDNQLQAYVYKIDPVTGEENIYDYASILTEKNNNNKCILYFENLYQDVRFYKQLIVDEDGNQIEMAYDDNPEEFAHYHFKKNKKYYFKFSIRFTDNTEFFADNFEAVEAVFSAYSYNDTHPLTKLNCELDREKCIDTYYFYEITFKEEGDFQLEFMFNNKTIMLNYVRVVAE